MTEPNPQTAFAVGGRRPLPHAPHCELLADSFGSITLAPGRFALITKGQGHALRTGPAVATPDVLNLPHEMVGERFALLRYGGAGAASTLICGVVRFQHHTAHNLIGLLPPIICVDSFASLNSDWMQTTLQLMAFEARQPSPGGETIVTRLADIFVIQAIRSWLQRDPAAKTGWLGLGAVQDRQVGRALAVIHREPANDWSVESLATVAAMSRSGFAARFSALVGQTPMHYVTNVRMRVANELLTTEKGLTIGEVAARLRLSVGGRFQPRIQAFQWQNTRGLPPRKLELGCGTTPASSEKSALPVTFTSR